ncbi:MAG: T9SS type A sorting domain-containing protein [Bacteroidales bacterium]|nr:T9SS type A sorting domain-containing protein [Bacteroidales bacterium]
MKKFTTLICLMIILSSILFAQSNSDIDLNAKTNPQATNFTDDLFEEQFQFPCGDCSGEAGIETNGEYIYTSKWNGDGFFCYEMDGTFLGAFPVPGEAAVRDLAYDGTYFYGAAANTALYEMDFYGQSGVLISTLTAAVATRACAYDPEFDAFWGNNWSDPITLYDRSGGILNQFNCGEYSSYYGFARLFSLGEQWLYGFAQSGGASQTVIVQIDPETGAETGVTFDAIEYSYTGTGIAGGLAAFDTYAPGLWTLLGIIQNETVFGVEGGFAVWCWVLDLKLTGIIEPNGGFGLGIENIVIGIKNYGAQTQSNFDVRYRVNGGEWLVENCPGPVSFTETIEYTFITPYNFSEFGEYYIEAEVLLPGDEFPENNYADKTITNLDPEQWCNYSITMWDTYGDGWNGGYVQIFGDGVEFVNATLASGYGPETIEFLVQDEAFLSAVWTEGGWPEECFYEVYDADDNFIFADGPNPTGGDIGYSSCEPPPPIDAGVTEIISPQSGMLLGIEPVTIKVKNFGSEPLSEIPVGFKFNENNWVNEVIPGPLAHNEEIEYTFNDSVDLTGIELIYIVTCTFVPDDTISINDCQSKEIYNPGDLYCDAWTNNEDEWIANVSMGLIDNSSGWQGGVADYTDLYTPVAIGIPEEIIVTNGNAWASDKVTAWCDWNDDFIFNNEAGSNEKFVLINDGTGAVFAGDILAPAGIPYGEHRMRIRMTYSDDPVPCGESSYGEVEDYTLVAGSGFEGIIWEPASFNQYVDVGQTEQDFLIIGSIGIDPLYWAIEVVFPYSKDSEGNYLFKETDGPWLNVIPSEGVVQSQVSDTVSLYFNAQDWPAGTELNAEIVLYSNDPTIPIINIPVTMTVGQVEPHFIFEGGNPAYPIWTNYIGGATLNNNDLEANDEIAIFDGDLMVGLITLDQVCTMDNVFDNDLTAFSVLSTQAGYQAGNEFTFKCWDASEQEESYFFNYEFFNPYGDAYMGDVFPSGDGEYSLVILDFETIYQPFDLDLGYQIISSAFDPIDPDMIVLMANVLNENLDFIRNSDGQMLRKIGSVWVNGIGNWIVEEGYLVKMFAPDSFSIIGSPVNPTTPIPLETGYQFVSYFPFAPMDALLAFETIMGDDLDFIRNSAGNMLRKIGPVWVNGIGDCNPTEGYLVKMFSEGEIIYPIPTKLSGKTTLVPKHFIFEGGNAADPVYTIYIDGLEIGDEVAVYDGDILVGAMKINSENVFDNDIPVFSTLNNGQGYMLGQALTLSVWDNKIKKEFPVSYEFKNPYGTGHTENYFPTNDGEYSILNIVKNFEDKNSSSNINVYPNPSDGIFSISIEKVRGDLQCKVFDLKGNEYRSFEFTGINGFTVKQLDLKDLLTGVYFISFTSRNLSRVEKIVIH